MDYFIYIHGFNSGRGSRSGRLLSELVGEKVFCPEYDCSQSFAECFAFLNKLIVGQLKGKEDRICLMGCSLGGFYALQMRHPAIAHVIAWNPVIFPAAQMRPLVGWNRRFTDGKEWQFTVEACRSYAAAPDPRIWCNSSQFLPECHPAPPRDIFLGDKDALLDSELARIFWNGHADLHTLHSGHSIEDFSPCKDVVLSGFRS